MVHGTGLQLISGIWNQRHRGLESPASNLLSQLQEPIPVFRSQSGFFPGWMRVGWGQ